MGVLSPGATNSVTEVEKVQGDGAREGESVRLGRGVVIESGAIVEAREVGEGTVVEVGARVGRGCVVGKVCPSSIPLMLSQRNIFPVGLTLTINKTALQTLTPNYHCALRNYSRSHGRLRCWERAAEEDR